MCKISPVFKQFLAIVSCNFLAFAFGHGCGWATINFIELQSENGIFPSQPLTLEEASLVVSILNVGGLLGNFIALPIIHRFGIKRTVHICGVPMILSSLLIIWAQNVYYLYISRLLAGVIAGIITVGIPSLVVAISDDKVRGTLNALFDPFSNTGTIISFGLGNYLNWRDQAKTQLIAPAIAIIILFFLPEAPEYWTKRNKEKRGIEAHKFYKGSVAALEQAEFLQKRKFAEKYEENLEKTCNEIDSDSKLCLRDFFTPHAKRAFFITFTGFTLCICSGTSMIVSYVTDIFTKTGSSISAKDASILVSVTQIVANFMFLNIVDRFNRRTLLIYSSLLTIISLFLYAVYCLLWINQPEYQWIPIVCFAMIVFFSWMGQLPIPFTVMTEIFPKKIRQTSIAISNSMFWILSFVLGSIFPIMLETFGPFICMTSFGVICSISLVFNIVYLPETRGKSYDEILKIMTE